VHLQTADVLTDTYKSFVRRVKRPNTFTVDPTLAALTEALNFFPFDTLPLALLNEAPLHPRDHANDCQQCEPSLRASKRASSSIKHQRHGPQRAPRFAKTLASAVASQVASPTSQRPEKPDSELVTAENRILRRGVSN
jgi:hypothetical protein